MAIFTVHVPPGPGGPSERADRTAFVREGFSVWAFLFGPLFLLRHRAWLAALAWIVVVIGGAFAARAAHLPAAVDTALLLLVALFTGLEGNAMRRYGLERRGFDFADIVAANGREGGERAFFSTWVPGDREAGPPHRAPARVAGGGVIGSFADMDG